MVMLKNRETGRNDRIFYLSDVSRELGRRGTTPINVSDFSDQKDGEDWTPAIQAAVNAAAAAGGGDVFFPNGDYGTLFGVTVPSSVRLVAQSPGVVAVGVELVRNASLAADGKVKKDQLPELSSVVVEHSADGYPDRPDEKFVTFIGPNPPEEQKPYDQWIQTAGFFYWTDFTGATIDALPPGWTKRWDTNADYVIKDGVAGASNGLAMQLTSQAGASTAAAISWDDVGDDFRGDAEMLIRARGGTNTGIQISPVLRGSGAGSGDASGYFAGPRPLSGTPSNVRIYKWTGGVLTSIAETASAYEGSKWLWIRVRVQGDRITLKVWLDGTPEPGAWDLDENDTDHESGWVGITHLIAGPCQVDMVGVATGGGVARSEAAL